MSDASDRRIVQGRIRRLELLLRLSSGDRARDLRQALDQLYAQVGKAPVRPDPVALMKDTLASAAGVNGVGGLAFEVNAPPGIGRLVAIPLYLYELDNQPTFPSGVDPKNPQTGWTTVTTGAGALQPDEVNPTVIVNIPPFATDGVTANRKVSGLYFRSPILEWATVRIVGFQVSTKACPLPDYTQDLPTGIPIPNGGGFLPGSLIPQIYTSNQRPTLLVRNLNVGGSANLFPQGEYVDATVYSTLLPEYAGLRDNPILASPNRAYLSAAVVGVPYTSMTFTIQLIVDVLDDTEFGRHQPGPYARRGAQGRTPSVDSVSYVTR
jgi:hypothetical protein